MKPKTSKQPKQSKPTVQLKDIKPKKDAKAGVAVDPSDPSGNTVYSQKNPENRKGVGG